MISQVEEGKAMAAPWVARTEALVPCGYCFCWDNDEGIWAVGCPEGGLAAGG